MPVERLRGVATLDRSIGSTWRGLDVRGVGGCGCAVAFALGLLIQAARAEELKQPPVCSPLKLPIPSELKAYCKIETLDGKTLDGKERHKITVNLTAHTITKDKTNLIEVGGYKVTTEHYNDSYLTPVIEALPGDTVAAQLVNGLPDLPTTGSAHTMANVAAGVNPTNLHFFHGGIVSPNNARPKDARDGTGDNIYVWLKNVWLKNGADSKPFHFTVPIPGKGELDARVLEGKGFIPHPNGLNWYHSHLHRISSAK